MNKLFTKITSLALGAAMMIGVGVSVGSKSKVSSAYADSVTITFADEGWGNASTHADFTISNFRFLKSGSGNDPAYYTSDSTLRYYKNTTLTISSTNGASITAVSASAGSFSVSGGTASASFSATTKISAITITYTGGGSTTTDVQTTTTVSATDSDTTLDLATANDSITLTASVSSTPAVTNPTVSFGASPSGVVTITTASGALQTTVTAVAVGTATITVSFAQKIEGTNKFLASSTTIEVEVIDSSAGSYEEVYSTGFESNEGFEASTTYNTTKTVGPTSPTSKQWTVYYGTPSTGTPLAGSQSMQMRWYANASSNVPYCKTNFAVADVKKIEFQYKSGNSNVDFITQYSLDGGNAWTSIETVDVEDNSAHTYKKVLGTSISPFYFRILLTGTAPSSGNTEFRVDSVKFYKELTDDTTTVLEVTSGPSGYNAQNHTWSGYNSDTISVSDFTVSCTTTVTPATGGYEFQGLGTGEGGNFVATDPTFTSGNPINGYRLQWKAKYPSTPKGTSFLYAYVALSVTTDTVSSVSASIASKTYYSGDTLSADDFTVSATWAHAGSQPVTSGFTWKVNGTLNGELSYGSNTIVVTYETVDSDNIVVNADYAPGTENNPYTVSQALAAPTGSDKYVTGYIVSITEVSTQHGNATYTIGDAVDSETTMIVYRGKYLDNTAFTAEDQIKTGDLVIVTGSISTYQSVNQMAQGNYITSLIRTGAHAVTISSGFELSVDSVDDSGSITITTDAMKKGNISNVTNANYTLEGNVLTLTNVVGDVAITASLVNAEVSSLSLSDQTKKYLPGSTFSFDGSVTATYDDWVSPHSSAVISSGYSVDDSDVDMDTEGTYTVIVTYGGKTASYQITVANVFINTTGEYHLLEENNLKVGDHIVIAAHDTTTGKDYSDEEMVMTSFASNNVSATNITVSSKGIISNDEAHNTDKDKVIDIELVEGFKENSFALKVIRDDEDVFLRGGYAGSSGNNYLRTTDSKDSNEASFVFTCTGGHWSVLCQGESQNVRNTLQYNPNNNSPIFTCYASASQTEVKIYKFISYETEATEYAGKFLKANGSSFASCSATISAWDTLKTAYGLLTEGAKALFAGEDHVPSETYSESTEISVKHAVCRYDDALIKHAELRGDNDFIGRINSGKLQLSINLNPIALFGDNGTSTTVIIIISVIGVSALGGFFFLRKRKEI